MKIPAVLPDAFLRCMSATDRASLAPGQSTKQEVEVRSVIKCEADLQRMIVGYLRVNDVEVLWHRMNKRSHATLGWPDITFAVNGRAVAWEVKLPGQKPEEHQLAIHERMTKNGWRVEVITSFQMAVDRFGMLTAPEVIP